jgi:hypothetical protein
MLKSGITKTSRVCVAAHLTWSVPYRDLLAGLHCPDILTGVADRP